MARPQPQFEALDDDDDGADDGRRLRNQLTIAAGVVIGGLLVVLAAHWYGPMLQSFLRREPAPVAKVYYRDCLAARAAGAAPIYKGQNGYRSALDGDANGIACEANGT